MCATEDHLACEGGGGGISDGSSSAQFACRPTFDKRWICMSYAFAADHCLHCLTLRPTRDAECSHHCIHWETLADQSVCGPVAIRKVCISAVDKHVSTLQLTARMNKISKHINVTNNCRPYVVTQVKLLMC